MSDAHAERADIIQFWHTVEMFSPPSVPEVDRNRSVHAIEPGEPLPWESGHRLAKTSPGKDRVWRHVVYVGTYPLDSVFEALKRIFDPDEDSFDERPAGSSALAAFVVSGQGRALLGSEVLSSCAWATGRALHPGPKDPGWLAGFEDASEAFSRSFAALVAAHPDDKEAEQLWRAGHAVGRCLRADDLLQCRDAAAKVVKVGTALPHLAIRVRSDKVAARNAPEGAPFLNSFLAEDLAVVASEARSGNSGIALRDYLRAEAALDPLQRLDVRKRLDSVLEATAPTRVPLGRWPSKPEHPLALGQQLAVDTALEMLDTGAGLLGVNGPPGTGKTTMLRDVIAAVVVERARRLAQLSHPRDAFTGRRHWKTDKFDRTVHLWRPELTGFEMVVASANNGAVENVTNEIPAHDAIDERWRDEAGKMWHFPDIASALLGADHEGAAWALVAARLGNRKNRKSFVNGFWYGDVHEHRPGFMSILEKYETDPPPASGWAEAVAEFRTVEVRAESMQSDRHPGYERLVEHDRIERDVQRDRHASHEARRDKARALGLLADAERSAQAEQAELAQRLHLRVEHRRIRPGRFAWTTSARERMRSWRAQDRMLAAEIAAARKGQRRSSREIKRFAREAEAFAESVVELEDSVRRGERDMASLSLSLDEARRWLGACFPDSAWRLDPAREVRAPWTDPEWNSTRTELFLAALRLHRSFLRHAPVEMSDSLRAAVDVVEGSAPKALAAESVLAAWQALFFAVPVVSTTFASFDRVFSHLGREALGWLLIDEAGQATPQSAVGALWRSKRAVVVGDPLQLEPITTLPFKAEQAIRNAHGVAEQWLSSRTSVQRLADRVTRFGTELRGTDENTWVGAPLTVHRRCDQPMFGIVNEIAYDGLMIHQTDPDAPRRFRDAYPSLPGSKWINVVSDDARGHWIPDEGKVLDRLLKVLNGLGFDMSEVMVVAPFRDIASEVHGYTRTYPGLIAGTIHTAQGKQADIVVLVLGGDPRRPGARRWAAAKPNLLNVAASRAKRRLYVIGDREAWRGHRHFDVLARCLSHSGPR